MVMKKIAFFLLALLLGGCAKTTAVKNLTLPPVSIIEGVVTQLQPSGFTLSDSSGAILVRADLPEDKKLNLAVNEQVTVYGNLRGGRERIFDGYVIKKQTGEQIMITRPQPHLGFVLQTSFPDK
jgi:hypothetical protein